MKSVRVRDAQLVIVLSKAEAKALLHILETGYVQKTKQYERILYKVKWELAE